MAEVRLNHRSFNAGVCAGMFTVPGDGRIDFGPLAGFARGSAIAAGWWSRPSDACANLPRSSARNGSPTVEPIRKKP